MRWQLPLPFALSLSTPPLIFIIFNFSSYTPPLFEVTGIFLFFFLMSFTTFGGLFSFGPFGVLKFGIWLGVAKVR